MNLPSDLISPTSPLVHVQTLGPARYPSPLGGAPNDAPPLFLPIDASCGDVETPGYYGFSPAGPRARLYFEPSTVTCAIATCGGLCPGINNVIQSVVLTAHNRYRVRAVLGIPFGLRGCVPGFEHKPVELTPRNVADIHEKGGTILGTSRGPQDCAAMAEWLRREGVQVLFLIGGDGTMQAAAALHRHLVSVNMPVAVVGIPKTIDNDIHFVPRSFGFDTAVQQSAEALRCAYTEAASVINGIGLVKVMGRHSGFIAAHAALSTNYADVVLIPEVPFRMEGPGGLLDVVEARLRDQSRVVLVVAEGAGQEYTGQGEGRDASGNAALGDIGLYIRDALARHLQSRKMPFAMKYVDPGYMIRSLKANASDHLYCRMLGSSAVHAALSGCTGMVVASIMDHIVHVPLELVSRKRRQLHPDGQLWKAAQESLPFPFPAPEIAD